MYAHCCVCVVVVVVSYADLASGTDESQALEEGMPRVVAWMLDAVIKLGGLKSEGQCTLRCYRFTGCMRSVRVVREPCMRGLCVA
jgi:hypothetical protein